MKIKSKTALLIALTALFSMQTLSAKTPPSTAPLSDKPQHIAEKKHTSIPASVKRKLLGKHMFSLQWISWDYFGTVYIREKNGVLTISGEQTGENEGEKGKNDYVRIDGIITSADKKSFVFEGDIITKVHHIANGEACKRSGKMNFLITGSRKYWRLQEMDNPCSHVVDYVDVFFR